MAEQAFQSHEKDKLFSSDVSLDIPIWLHLRIIVKVIPYFLADDFQKCPKIGNFAKKIGI